MATILSGNIRRAAVLPSVAIVKASARVDYEALATRHFVFNKGNSGNLTCLKTANMMTVVGSAPTHNAGSLTMGAAGNLLHAGIPDSLKWSAWVVMKVPPTLQGSGFGLSALTTYTSSAGVPQGGLFVGLNAGTTLEMTGRATIAGENQTQSWNTADLAVGSWAFVALVVDHSGSNRLRRYGLNQRAIDFTDVGVITPHASQNISLGANSSQPGGMGGAEYADYGIVDGVALTKEELAAIYYRAKARAFALNGIIVG